jgi:hypothetical protein
MELHRNAKLGLSGRLALVQACEQGVRPRRRDGSELAPRLF